MLNIVYMKSPKTQDSLILHQKFKDSGQLMEIEVKHIFHVNFALFRGMIII